MFLISSLSYVDSHGCFTIDKVDGEEFDDEFDADGFDDQLIGV